MRKKVLVAGAGKVGSLVACLLASLDDYQVYLADVDFHYADAQHVIAHLPVKQVKLDMSDQQAVAEFLKTTPLTAIVSSLPFHLNPSLAKLAKQFSLHYFDLTEDTKVTETVKALSVDSEQAWVPQCGLAPGFVSILAHHMMGRFDELQTVKLRVGALPQSVDNHLRYALTWSTEGLINQYANPCWAIEEGELCQMAPLHGRETLFLEGTEYEAFNTSGGLGSLADSYHGKVQALNYKTIRYPGHCERMRFLMQDLQLGRKKNRSRLKDILEEGLPHTYQDVVLIYVSVTGMQRGHCLEENYVKRIYPQTIANRHWSALQVATASSLCVVIDNVLAQPDAYKGLILQEQFSLSDFLGSRLATYYV